MRYIEIAVPDDFDDNVFTTYDAVERNLGIGPALPTSRDNDGANYEPHETEFEIRHQGGVLIEQACVVCKAGVLVVIEINTKTKYTAIGVLGSGCVALETRPESLYVKEDVRDQFTFIELPEFKDWTAICAMGGRYTATVVLKKPG